MIANDNRVQIVLAAGGTGGHMFPAEALAEALLRRGCRVDLITDERGQGFGNRLPEVAVHHVSSGGVAGKGPVPKLKNIARLALGYFQCRSLIRRLDPIVTVGFGGYPSVPPLLAAQQRECRTVLHEQNAVAGRANRFLMKRASKVALSFPQVRFTEDLPAEKRIVTGNPVRPAIAALADQPYRAPRGHEPINLLIFGGSLGARSFSRHIPAGIALMSADLRNRLRIVQQCRPEDLDAVADAFHFVGIGGIGMSGIAEVLHNLGYKVQGSTVADGAPMCSGCASGMGIAVEIGTAAENLGNASRGVVVSSAIKKDNPELMAARARMACRWCAAPRCWPN
jgi:UDP-N-acetylglucosamine--N-acetylmuramyl-(pentapeptide) pyrophosphoryl-undecaprenol N-acetylglucosamine transferase